MQDEDLQCANSEWFPVSSICPVNLFSMLDSRFTYSAKGTPSCPSEEKASMFMWVTAMIFLTKKVSSRDIFSVKVSRCRARLLHVARVLVTRVITLHSRHVLSPFQLRKSATARLPHSTQQMGSDISIWSMHTAIQFRVRSTAQPLDTEKPPFKSNSTILLSLRQATLVLSF